MSYTIGLMIGFGIAYGTLYWLDGVKPSIDSVYILIAVCFGVQVLTVLSDILEELKKKR